MKKTVFRLSTITAALCGVFLTQSVIAQPQFVPESMRSGTLFSGRSFSFTPEVFSDYTMTLQWGKWDEATATYTNVVNVPNHIDGATTAVLTFTGLTVENSGRYILTATDQNGTEISPEGSLTVAPVPEDAYGIAVLADNPVAYWRMNETNTTEGATLFDYVGGFNGWYYGGVTPGQPGISAYNTNATVLLAQGGAGVDHHPELTPSIFTIEVWARPTGSISDVGTVIHKRGGSEVGWTMYGWGYSDPDTWHMFLGNGSAWTDIPAGQVTQGQWHHLVATYDGTHWINYVNGVQTLNVEAVYVPSSGGIQFGNLWGGSWWPGNVAEAAIYNTSLSAEQVKNHYAAAISGGFTPPTITQQPESVGVYAGQNATFSAVVESYEPPTYQWMTASTGSGTFANVIQGGNVSGATTATLSITAATTANAADYVLVASNTLGSVTSSIVSLTIKADPTVPEVLSQPQPVTLLEGRNAELTVAAVGVPPLSYKWQFATQVGGPFTDLADQGGVSGSAAATLTLTDVTLAQGGWYRVIVSNTGGSATSEAVRVTVQPLPALQLSLPLAEASPTDPSQTKSDTTQGQIDITLSMLIAGSTPAALIGAPGTGLTPTSGSLDQTVNTVPGQGETQPGGGAAGARVTSAALASLGNNGSISNFVVSFWFNQAVRPPWTMARIFVLNPSETPAEDQSPNSMGLAFVWGNQFTFYFGSWSGTFAAPFDYPNNEWTFAAIAGDGATAPKAYIGTTELPVQSCSAPMYAGAWTPGSFLQMEATPSLTLGNTPIDWSKSYNGKIANFRIYNGRTDGEFIESIRASAVPPTLPPVLDYTFSNGTLTLNWTDGTLEEATDVNGLWTPSSATSPLSVQTTAAKKFYRLVK